MGRFQRLRPPAASGGLPEPAAESGPADTKPDAAGWTLQLKGVSIPAGPVTGRIKGRDFNSEKASVENGWLKFAQGADFFADLKIDVVLFINDSAETERQDLHGSEARIWQQSPCLDELAPRWSRQSARPRLGASATDDARMDYSTNSNTPNFSGT